MVGFYEKCHQSPAGPVRPAGDLFATTFPAACPAPLGGTGSRKPAENAEQGKKGHLWIDTN